MKKHYVLALMAAVVLAGTLFASPGWSNRVFSDKVTGEITATPISGEIEVDHHIYRVRSGTPADESLHGFSEGQRVELTLDGPVDASTSQVMKISLRSAS